MRIERVPGEPGPLVARAAQRPDGAPRIRLWPLLAGLLLLASAAIVVAGWVFFFLGIARLGE